MATACRAMALTIEELRALLATVLGLSNMVLIFINRALAYEQQQLDKAQLNLSVLQKQVRLLSQHSRHPADRFLFAPATLEEHFSAAHLQLTATVW